MVALEVKIRILLPTLNKVLLNLTIYGSDLYAKSFPSLKILN